MTTLESLREELMHRVSAAAAAAGAFSSSWKRPRALSDAEYSAGFDILEDNPGTQSTYQRFIIPQLRELLGPLTESGTAPVSVLEIGPGPRSILGSLPWHIRCGIRKYTAFEPNTLFAARLQDTLVTARKREEYPLPRLESRPDIRQRPFLAGDDSETALGCSSSSSSMVEGGDEGKDEKFDVILFCHGMYGMRPKEKLIERALGMLAERADNRGLVVVFHGDQALRLDGLVCHRTATFSTGLVHVRDDDDEVLDRFASFVAGFAMHDDAGAHPHTALRMEWRRVCRALGQREDGQRGPEREREEEDEQNGPLVFSAAQIMVAFAKHAMTALPELAAQAVPLRTTGSEVKNRQARRHHAACIVRPTEIRHVQRCVTWALRHGAGLTVLGGGHSDHCLWPNVVAVDMGAFDQVHVVERLETETDDETASPGCLVVAGAGCTTGDIVRETLAAGLTVPLGSRPSVGAGLPLQGGIGHLARLHGLACDAIVGAVVVSVAAAGPVLCVGRVPSQHRPVGSVAAETETEAQDMLWALRGAGTNMAIVVSITFKAYAAPVYSVRNWMVLLSDDDDDDDGDDGTLHARRALLDQFDNFVASTCSMPRNGSAAAHLCRQEDKLRLGLTLVDIDGEPSHAGTALTHMRRLFGPELEHKTVDGIGLFATALYMSGMHGGHGGHGGGKTSSFKRCLFLPRIADAAVVETMIGALEARPSPLCHLHLQQGGGAIRQVAPGATAFGCRDWDFACVVTGVWPRDQDGTKASRAAIRWVYNVARHLMPLSCGAYGADLGPDPRDAALAARAFGPNRARLVRLKDRFDPHHVLAFACPLTAQAAAARPLLIILVTGEHGAGKDYCADIWVSMLATCRDHGLTARAVSISDETKREYAAATGAHPGRLLGGDRCYKEQHRAALTAFHHAQLRQRPRLREEHFQKVLTDNSDCEVLLITGMRDEAPVAALSHLVPTSRLLEIRVEAGGQTRQARRGVSIGIDGSSMRQGGASADDELSGHNGHNGQSQNGSRPHTPDLAQDCPPSFIFTNEARGSEAAKRFAQRRLLPFCNNDLERLASMVRSVRDFPRSGIVFRHVLDIAQQPGGLDLCTSLLQAHFAGDWRKVDVVACCEFGGIVYASALAMRVGASLALIREAGKLPPPTVSVTTRPSHISSFAYGGPGSGEKSEKSEKSVELGRSAIPTNASVVVVDDVLASGTTLCAVLQLLDKAGVGADKIHVMVVAEFPIHRGRETLRRRGFGRVQIQSLVILDGV
ncbi:hypothetical protein E4U54_003371 [Claviceps lovelessii]|nr:hypothetical protein E4U54_003371 [Claviceps lovelessii]